MANKSAGKHRKKASKLSSLELAASGPISQKENVPIQAVMVKEQSPKQQSPSAPLLGRKSIGKTKGKERELGYMKGAKGNDVPLSADSVMKTLKRQKSPGVRIIGGRIYDSENGQTCHQCRQKTIEIMAPCKNASGVKVCSQKFCPKCLLNRYGEKVEEVVKLVDWFCPRCRGTCNCSVCMKRRGCSPTGILTHTAKATGFESVADYLKQGSEKMNVIIEKTTKEIVSELKQCDQQVKSTKKKPKLKSKLKGSTDQQIQEAQPKSATKHCVAKQDQQVNGVKKNGKVKQESKFLSDGQFHSLLKRKGSAESVVTSDVTETGKPKTGLHKKQKTSKHTDNCQGDLKKESVSTAFGKNKIMPTLGADCKSSLNELMPCADANGCVVEVFIPIHQCKRVIKTKLQEDHMHVIKTESHEDHMHIDTEGGKSTSNEQKLQEKGHLLSDIDPQANHFEITCTKEDQTGAVVPSVSKANQNPKEQKVKSHKVKALKKKADELEFRFPQGDQFYAVAGVDLPGIAIGPALQLIEFCSAFGGPLELKKGQADNILRELCRSGLTRRGAQSQLVQLHVKLLSLIEEEDEEPCKVTSSIDGKSSWLRVFTKHLRQRSCFFTKENKNIAKRTKDVCFRKLNYPDSPSSLRLFAEVSSPMSEEEQRMILKSLDDGIEGYMNWDAHTKLRLLNMLCDDSLCTSLLRGYIEAATAKYEEKQKETREKVLAAKKEAKEAIQKKKDAEVKRLLAMESNEHAPLTLDEQSALLSKVNEEAENVHSARLALSQVASKMRGSYRHDAVRTEPVTQDDHGCVLWRLKGADNRARVVLQDVSNGQAGAAAETWSIYSKEQEDLVVKYITSNRLRNSRKKHQGQEEDYSTGISKMPVKGTNLPHNQVKAECKDPPLDIPDTDVAEIKFPHRMQINEDAKSDDASKESKPDL